MKWLQPLLDSCPLWHHIFKTIHVQAQIQSPEWYSVFAKCLNTHKTATAAGPFPPQPTKFLVSIQYSFTQSLHNGLSKKLSKCSDLALISSTCQWLCIAIVCAKKTIKYNNMIFNIFSLMILQEITKPFLISTFYILKYPVEILPSTLSAVAQHVKRLVLKSFCLHELSLTCEIHSAVII